MCGRRLRCVAMGIAVSLALSGCMLLPQEEEPYTVRVVNEDIFDRYELGMAEVRDVVLTDTISCTYSQLSEENLSFELGGRTVNSLYVSEGDQVRAGQVLAALYVDDLVNEIENYEDMIARYEVKIKQDNEMIELYTNRLESGRPVSGNGELTLADREEYLLKIQEYKESIITCESVLTQMRSEIDVDTYLIGISQIVSPIDGSISFIKDNLLGSMSTKGTKAITVIDTSVCAFQARDREAVTYMQVGDAVQVVTAAGQAYAATVSVVDAEEYKVVFELDEPDYTISVGTKGTVHLVRDERSQVLSIPREAVFSTEEFYYVYQLSDSGVREIRKVTVGLIGDSYVEITGGIGEYDSVILRSK